jgi:radical SAM modification target selenobiotic family peptide
MRNKNITSYLAGLCVTALLAGSVAAPTAALGGTG